MLLNKAIGGTSGGMKSSKLELTDAERELLLGDLKALTTPSNEAATSSANLVDPGQANSIGGSLLSKHRKRR